RLPWLGALPGPEEWPHAARAGESAALVRNEQGWVLAVRAPSVGGVRELATGLAQRRAAGVIELAVARSTLIERWRRESIAGPIPPLSPDAECASMLLARAQLLRESARELPAPYAGPASLNHLEPPVRVFERLQELELAAGAHDPAALSSALVAEATEEHAWFASGVPSRAALAPQRGAAWRRWQLERADSLSSLAARTMGPATPLQQEVVLSAIPERLLGMAASQPELYAELIESAPSPDAPVAVPLPDVWGRLLGIGALLGAAGSISAAVFTRGMSRGGRPTPIAFMPSRDPHESGPWLHLVSGPNPSAITRATLELSAPSLARGERVLVVDGSPRLSLHERFGREARWGLNECLLADMPVLGLVQYGGRPGFYLLAHGNSQRGDGWPRLGQRLDDARPHFGRVILAVDANAPRAIGDSLAGRALEGWWADPVKHLPEAAIELSGRLGIAFSPMDLAGIPENSLEVLSERVTQLQPSVARSQWNETPPATASQVTVALVPTEPVILDCDLQVRQRLRFLAWMRRVQAEGRRTEDLESISS
ncbi:MAG: hypothetical protein ABIU54_08260, partial [Candidatus Eisenbacteria bacterium]